MADQTEQNVTSGVKTDEDGAGPHKDKSADMDMEYLSEDVEAHPIQSHVSLRKNAEEQTNASAPEMMSEEGIPTLRVAMENSIVAVERSFVGMDIDNQLNEESVARHQLRTVYNDVEVASDMNNAAALWRKYELQTTRLSQELAEQLRLVMEPTLASKLEGDYRTGKRINMKKVIPYVASHYRKDKIWLRRTKPNKRDYQVMIAMDDSHSMLESGCGDVAIEALVTVCRAMSQLEVGKLAVTSFGKEGNIKLLNDFDQPFTGEAGIKMISSLTFKQNNDILQEPMVDLLTYLNHTLNEAAAKARLPSGQHPLQQLVLIISDGYISERDKLKRYVRELTNQKRMVVFLVVDSSHESIMQLEEASGEGREMKLTNYLDTFPFPYYIILKNIEALPRILADLLRQWFEIMQNTRD